MRLDREHEPVVLLDCEDTAAASYWQVPSVIVIRKNPIGPSLSVPAAQ